MSAGNQNLPKDLNQTGVRNETAYTADGTVTERQDDAVHDEWYLGPNTRKDLKIGPDEQYTWILDPSGKVGKTWNRDRAQELRALGGKPVLDSEGEVVRRNPDSILYKYPMRRYDEYKRDEAEMNGKYLAEMRDEDDHTVSDDDSRVDRPRSLQDTQRRSRMMRDQGIIGPTSGDYYAQLARKSKSDIEAEEAMYRTNRRTRETPMEEFTALFAPGRPEKRGSQFAIGADIGKSTKETIAERHGRSAGGK